MAIERVYVCDSCGKRVAAIEPGHHIEPEGWGNVWASDDSDDNSFDLYLCDVDYPRVRAAVLDAVAAGEE